MEGENHDSLDRLNSASTSTQALGWTYDADGNRLSASSVSPPPVVVSALTYNNRGRMINATTNLGAMSGLYNALGQRIEKATSTTATLFYYDEAGHLIGEYNNSGNLIEETVWVGDLPVATLQPNGTGGVNVFYIHADHLGVPKSITQPSSGAIVWRWDQDPFGTATPNQNPSNLGAFVYNLRFPGQYYDQETGLNYNYFRDYDPSTGRYIESDPIGLMGGISTYGFVRQSPIDYGDPLGLFPWPRLPGTDDCKPDEWSVCTAKCAPRKAIGCYVTVKWKLKGIRGGEPIRSEQRNVECNCEDPPHCLDATRPAPKEGRGKRGGSSNNQDPFTLIPWWEWLVPAL